MHDVTRSSDHVHAAGRDPVLMLTRVLLATVGPDHAVDVLLAQFGWDRTFLALATCTDRPGARAFEIAWERLVLGPLTREVAPVRPSR